MAKQIYLNKEGEREEVLFRADGVTATNSRFTFNGKTYNYADIVNVNTWNYKPGGGIILIGGALMLIVSLIFANGPGIFTAAVILSLSAYWLRTGEESKTHIVKIKFFDDQRVILKFKKAEDSVRLLRVYYLYLLMYELSSPQLTAGAKKAQ